MKQRRGCAVNRSSFFRDISNKKSTGKWNRAGSLTLSFKALLEEYRLSLEASNRSLKTITWYLENLTRFFNFLDSNGLLKSLGTLGARDLETYILHLKQLHRWETHPHIRSKSDGLSAHSIQGHIRAIKAFWTWLFKNGYLDHNTFAGFPLPKAPEKPFATMTVEQINQLLNAINRLTPKGAQLYMMIILLIDTGVRISELLNIQIRDIDLAHGFIQVLGKGGKVRTVPISSEAKKELMLYITGYCSQPCNGDSEHLFPDGQGGPVSVNSVQQALRRLAARAGIQGVRCSPHTFRHTFATEFTANGGGAFALRDIMGHVSINTTLKYMHLKPHDLQRMHAQYSPLARLNLSGTTRKGVRK